MGLYKFLIVRLWPLHLFVLFCLLLVLAFLWVTAGHVDVVKEVGQTVLVYAFFLFGIGVAIGNKLHRYVK